ncbi:hypothetical protein [Draconibacterium halophilum]|uniref:Uncharacterized protein n=1 Tax=Draconibacterium halophilum TaxID=2706887 RepID=A0A6C0RI14_9BACT|nr:hypothetical protein [Draconibacterium halophilum]QIA09676.1 hypothetical protein G0Q07_19075 [Draconibacterium halophilum]
MENINESYPIPLLLLIIFSLVFFQFLILRKIGAFKSSFSSPRTSIQRIILVAGLIIPLFFGLSIDNTDAEWSTNRYENEISKAGIYSFFAAFRNNELSYTDFYRTQDLDVSFSLLKEELKTNNDTLFSEEKYDITERGWCGLQLRLSQHRSVLPDRNALRNPQRQLGVPRSDESAINVHCML